MVSTNPAVNVRFYLNSYKLCTISTSKATCQRKVNPMKIAICDDQIILTRELSSALLLYQKERRCSFETIVFSSPDKLFAFMETDPIDLVFMDLEFGDSQLDGIAWSKRIHECFPNTLILILTSFDERYKEGFLVRAFRFMTKPILLQELYDNLDACFDELYLYQNITLMRLGVPHKVKQQDILYLSALKGGSEIWTVNDTFYSDRSLLSWEEQLPANLFFRCHKAYLVNLRHIKCLEHHVVVIKTGEKLPVSRRKWADLKLAFMRYDISVPLP